MDHVTTTQAINKEMGFNMAMNKYQSKKGREAVFHNNVTKFNTSDGDEWTRCDSIIVVPSAEIPKVIVVPDAPKVIGAPIVHKK